MEDTEHALIRLIVHVPVSVVCERQDDLLARPSSDGHSSPKQDRLLWEEPASRSGSLERETRTHTIHR